jgi:hypothetical protein
MNNQLLVSKQYRAREQQIKQLSEIEHSLKSYGIDLSISYSETLHDREIRFSNGWTVKIGRGLDYFKPTKVNLPECPAHL